MNRCRHDNEKREGRNDALQLRAARTILGKPVEEGLAARQLSDGDEFVGLVRLLDRARAADDGRNARFLEKARFGGVGHRGGLIGLRQAERQLGAGDLGSGWRPGTELTWR